MRVDAMRVESRMLRRPIMIRLSDGPERVLRRKRELEGVARKAIADSPLP
jgi:hypothetical protein